MNVLNPLLMILHFLAGIFVKDPEANERGPPQETTRDPETGL